MTRLARLLPPVAAIALVAPSCKTTETPEPVPDSAYGKGVNLLGQVGKLPYTAFMLVANAHGVSRDRWPHEYEDRTTPEETQKHRSRRMPATGTPPSIDRMRGRR